MPADPQQPKRRDVGWLVLLAVAFGWITLVVGIGVPFLLGGGLAAIVIAVTDFQDGRRVSRPVLAALVGSLAILVVGFIVQRTWSDGQPTSRSKRRGARKATEVQEQPTARLAPERQRRWPDRH